MLVDFARAREALHSISPDLPRDEWVRVLMAGSAAGLSHVELEEWSSQGQSFNPRDFASTVRSIKPGGGIGPRTLFWLADELGGHEKRRPRPAQAPQSPVKRRKRTRPGMSATEVWQRCELAADSHPYIEGKQGTAKGLRVVPSSDTLRIAGASVAGWLVVPVTPLGASEPTSLQFIPPPGSGKKLNLPGHEVTGVFTVGELATDGDVFLCEGVGQGWAIWKATGCAAVVCFGWGRVRGVATELRKSNQATRLVLVPDTGKEAEAEAIARELDARFVTMPEGWPANADVNDLAQRDGFDVLEALLLAPKAPAQRFRLLGASDLKTLPPLAWCVRGVLPAHGLASVYGPSGSGKSFLVLDAAAAIADGAEWFGYRVKSAPVVYCALEGEAGFRLRVAAWEKAEARALPTGLRLVLQPFKLTDPQDVADLAAAVLNFGGAAVVILDTLNRAAPEADENASADMGRILEAAKALQRLTGGLVLVVHHTGKDVTRGLRGHSSFLAALDAAVEVTREGDRREWRVAKSKDGQDGAGHPFRLEVVDLGEDDEGEPVTSCVVAPDDSPRDLTRCRLPKGGNQKVVLDALGELLRKSATFGRAGAPQVRPCVELEAAVDAIAPRLTCEPKRQKERVRQALTGLTASGAVTCREGWLWLP